VSESEREPEKKRGRERESGRESAHARAHVCERERDSSRYDSICACSRITHATHLKYYVTHTYESFYSTA